MNGWWWIPEWGFAKNTLRPCTDIKKRACSLTNAVRFTYCGLVFASFVSFVLLVQSLLQSVPLGYAIPKILWELSDGT